MTAEMQSRPGSTSWNRLRCSNNMPSLTYKATPPPPPPWRSVLIMTYPGILNELEGVFGCSQVSETLKMSKPKSVTREDISSNPVFKDHMLRWSILNNLEPPS